MTWLIVVVLLLVVSGLAFLRWSQRAAREIGLPAGRLMYDDSGAHEQIERPLLSRRYGLVGRPDYVVRRRENGREVVLPVEIKSGRAPQQPHPGHVLQVGAYCMLVEEVYGHAPPYGLIRYADGVHGVPFDNAIRRSVIEAAEAIRRARRAPDVPRSHETPERCHRCGYRAACGQSLD